MDCTCGKDFIRSTIQKWLLGECMFTVIQCCVWRLLVIHTPVEKKEEKKERENDEVVESSPTAEKQITFLSYSATETCQAKCTLAPPSFMHQRDTYSSELCDITSHYHAGRDAVSPANEGCVFSLWLEDKGLLWKMSSEMHLRGHSPTWAGYSFYYSRNKRVCLLERGLHYKIPTDDQPCLLFHIRRTWPKTYCTVHMCVLQLE